MDTDKEDWIVLVNDTDDSQLGLTSSCASNSSSPSNAENEILAHAILTDKICLVKNDPILEKPQNHKPKFITNALYNIKSYVSQRIHYILICAVFIQCLGSILYFCFWYCSRHHR